MELNTSLIGTVIGSLTVIGTVTAIWFSVIIRKPDLYVPVSWLLTIPTIGIVFKTYVYDFEVAGGFVMAYESL